MKQMVASIRQHVRTSGMLNIVGPIYQSNDVDAPNSDTAAQSNGAQITQNLDAVNDCDEEGTGFNLAKCENEDASH